MRRRGHLLKGLRSLANDSKATPKQRLEACKMLFALETDPLPRTSGSLHKAEYSREMIALAEKCERGSVA
jgi:hypothetical protein